MDPKEFLKEILTGVGPIAMSAFIGSTRNLSDQEAHDMQVQAAVGLFHRARADGEGELEPILHLVFREGGSQWPDNDVCFLVHGDKQKHLLTTIARSLERKLHRTHFLTEAWTTLSQPTPGLSEEEAERAEHLLGPVKDRPGRVEVLMVSTDSREGHRITTFPIQGKGLGEREDRFTAPGHSHGRVVFFTKEDEPNLN